jgi:putative methionine-R-sulfoxide reductase with GAF domain
MGSRSWVARHGNSLVLVSLGVVLLVASLFQGGGNAAYAFGLLIFGSGLVVFGVVLPRLQNAEVGPATGFKLTLAEDAQREASTGLAESDGGGTVQVDQVVAATRLLLASETLARLLAPEDGPLAGAWFHLYLLDEQRSLLLPAFEGRPSPSQGWAPGTGAVGEAWASGEYVLVQGEEVSDDTHGLTPAQQHRARNLALVAAMPVTNASGTVIAVVSASSADPDSTLATDEGFDGHLLVAQEVARVLVDLLHWFPD